MDMELESEVAYILDGSQDKVEEKQQKGGRTCKPLVHDSLLLLVNCTGMIGRMITKNDAEYLIKEEGYGDIQWHP
jgi:hypothetical protein